MEFGALATKTKENLLGNYLDGMVKEVEKDFSFEKAVDWPEEKFKKRYI